MSEPSLFWRFLPDQAMPDVGTLRKAGREGRGSLSRNLREARHSLGSHRAAALLRAARQGEAPFGRPLRVLLASPFQPRAIRDAVEVGFAIAGFSADIVSVDGMAALAAMLSGPDDADGEGADLALIPVFAGDAETLDLVLQLGGRLAEQRLVPLLVAVLGADESHPTPVTPSGVEMVAVAVEGAVADERFAATFGRLPSAEAADRLAETAAGFAARLKGTAPKLIVTDLDGTLWQGTLGEDGASGVRLHRPYADCLKSASERGLVLAIASRNDPADVERIFASRSDWPLAQSDFAAREIGWAPKDELVAACLAATGLGAEHMIVVDDDAVNCARIAARFPDADVRHFSESDPEAFARSLAADTLFARGEAGANERREHYHRREAVEHLRGESVDVADFLARLNTRLTAEPLQSALLPRAAELAARVNQFALTGYRPNVLQLGGRRSPLDFMLRLDDAFGAHGLVGLVLAHRDGTDAVLDNFLLSCRALGRGVEDAMLFALAHRARAEGCGRLRVAAEPLARNEPALRWFSRYVASDTLVAEISPNSLSLPEGISLTWKTATT